MGPASAAALSSSPPKKYMGGGGVDVRGLDTRGVLDARSAALDASNAPRGSDEWSDATWLNNLRISAGMDPIPMPSSNSVASKVGCFKKKIQCDKIQGPFEKKEALETINVKSVRENR